MWTHVLQRHMQNGICDEPNQVRCIPDNQRLDFKYTKYKKWFAPVAGHIIKKSFTYHLYRRDQVQAVAQFRMSAHWLNCERMRVAADGRYLPRAANTRSERTKCISWNAHTTMT